MLKKIVSKTLTFCLGLSFMTLYVESSSYDDFCTPTLDKRTLSESTSTNLLEENLKTKRPRLNQRIDAFLVLDKLVSEYVYDLETKDARRRRNLDARREYLNKGNHHYINRNTNSNGIQKQTSLDHYKNDLPFPDQRVFDEKPIGTYESIPSSIFQDMLIQVFCFMKEHNYYDQNFKDSEGRHYQYYLG